MARLRKYLAILLNWFVLLHGYLSYRSCSFSTPGTPVGGRSKRTEEPKQETLSLMREKVGARFRAQTRDAIEPLPLTPAEKELLNRLVGLSRKGHWGSVESAFRRYNGSCSAIYCQVMHAAFRCGRYERGVEVYKRLCDLSLPKTLPVYTLAIKLLAKSRQPALVEQTWVEALESEGMDVVLAGARIDAAAEEGDIVTAASVLDMMQTRKLKPDLNHYTSAVRACRNSKGVSHNAAKYLLTKLEEQGLVPDVIFFTALIRTYTRAKLEHFTSAFQKMKDLGIFPDKVFAETYLATLLVPDESRVRGRMYEDLRHLDRDRLLAAKEALQEFDESNVELTGLAREVKETLNRVLETVT